MDRVILLRHGEAEREAPIHDDFDRRLKPAGWRESQAVAALLAADGVAPRLALVSTAARARETWAACEPAFPAARVQYSAALYSADAAELRRLIASVAAEGAVMVVSHNPALQELAVAWAIESGEVPEQIGRLQRRFPTGAAAVFAMDADRRPRLEGVYLPPPDDAA